MPNKKDLIAIMTYSSHNFMLKSPNRIRKHSFMTSLDVIREVMNVSMEAIHAIARMNGISTIDDHERNISEKELHPFIEAFERKTRNYFVNSMRNYALLTPQEMQTFAEFCKTFRKSNVSYNKVNNWNQICKTRLRQSFVDKIKKKTSLSPTLHTIQDLFSGCGGMDLALEMLLYANFEPNTIALTSSLSHADFFESDSTEYLITGYHGQPYQDLLSQINSTWAYHARIESRVCYNYSAPDLLRQVILSAHYYIYIDDDDYHHMDTVSVNGQYDPSINSPLMMVV